MAVLVIIGHGSGLILFSAGGAEIFLAYPSFPMLQVLFGLFLLLAAFVPISIGAQLAFNMSVLKNLPKNAAGLKAAKQVRLETFAGIREAGTTLAKLYHSVVTSVGKDTGHDRES